MADAYTPDPARVRPGEVWRIHDGDENAPGGHIYILDRIRDRVFYRLTGGSVLDSPSETFPAQWSSEQALDACMRSFCGGLAPVCVRMAEERGDG